MIRCRLCRERMVGQAAHTGSSSTQYANSIHRYPVPHHLLAPRKLPRQQDGVRRLSNRGMATSSKLVQQQPQAGQSTPSFPMSIFSGIQPTGIPHIGNLLGALFNWVALQNSVQQGFSNPPTPPASLYFSIVGLHALTLPKQPATLAQERKDMLASLLAVGLDPHRSTIFHQDEVGEHAELHWLLSCLVSMGRLRRMTTWKSKIVTAKGDAVSEAQSALLHERQTATDSPLQSVDDPDVGEEHRDLSLALFSYPVLQAADVLLYKATHVPIGQDQIQHLELARDISATFNKRFPSSTSTDKQTDLSPESILFPLPQPLITSTPKILSLRDPTSKMSKSAPDPTSRILLTDDAEQIRAKIKRAVTDTEKELRFDPIGRPGVSSLLSIIAALRSWQLASIDGVVAKTIITPESIAEEMGNSGHALLKETVSSTLIQVLEPIQDRFHSLRSLEEKNGYLTQVAEFGREKAKKRAVVTLKEVRERMGLR